MTSKERLSAAWNGETCDHVPLTTWCFGLTAPQLVQIWEKYR